MATLSVVGTQGNAVKGLESNLLKELNWLQAKSCDNCGHFDVCAIPCGDIRVIQNIRQEVHHLAEKVSW